MRKKNNKKKLNIFKIVGISCISLALSFGIVLSLNNYSYMDNVIAQSKNIIKLNKTSLIINKGKNTVLKVSNSSNKSITWTSSNEKIAKVDSNGKVTGIGIGTATITATVDGNKLTCKVSIVNQQIKPGSKEKIVYHGDSDTLKAYIVNRGTYYLTYIWVKDAYTQINKIDSPEYGKNLYLPSDLLKKANTNNKLKNKIMIGFNASGFYLKNTFDSDSVDKYPKYNRTSVGSLVITDSKVVRNAYKYAVKTWYVTGINKDNKLVIFEDKKTTNTKVKQKWAQTVISSGIRNTFTFAAPVIQNGKKTNNTTSMPKSNTEKIGLQLMCQINENNFVMFTTTGETRNKAINVLFNMGCQTAMNLDGGGSASLLYKDKKSNTIKKVVGNNRKLAEVGYFTE